MNSAFLKPIFLHTSIILSALSFIQNEIQAQSAPAINSVEFNEKKGSVSVLTGMMQYEFSGVLAGTGTNAANMTAAYHYYPATNLATLFSYRMAFSEIDGRLLYQAGQTGIRYFPMNPGVPVSFQYNNQKVTMNFFYRPYIEGGGNIGNFLLRAIGERQGTTIASEFFGLFVGFGSLFYLAPTTALDLNFQFEHLQSISPLSFSSNNIYALIGLTQYL